MANIFRKKEVCPTCNGEKTILCCSCTADNECHTLVCPTCHGAGEIISYNTPVIIGVAVLGAVILLVGLVSLL